MKKENIIRLIIIEESSHEAEALVNVLHKSGYGIRHRFVNSGNALQQALSDQSWDLVICAYQVADFSIYDALEILERTEPRVSLIGRGDVTHEDLVTAMRAGAKDIAAKEHGEHLLLVVARELLAVTAQRNGTIHENRYQESERRCMALLDSSREAIAYVHDGMHIYANCTYLELFGYGEPDEVEGVPILDLVSSDDISTFKEFIRQLKDSEDEQSIEINSMRSDGRPIDAMLLFSRAMFDGEDCHQVIVRDRSHRQDFETKLRELSELDQETGLFNHQYFLTALEKAVSAAIAQAHHSALLLIELENVRAMRRTVGVAATDLLIKELANVVFEEVGEDGALARFGESTFSILTKKEDDETSERLAGKIRTAVKEHISDAGGQSVATTCSVAIVDVDGLTSDPQKILARADSLCRSAIQQGGNRVQRYDPTTADDAQVATNGLTAETIETAIRNGRVSLRYQPIISLGGDGGERYEVFPCLSDSDGSLTDSDTLFRVAANANIAAKLDVWMIERVIALILERQDRENRVNFFIPVSEQSIRDESVLLDLSKKLKQSKIAGDCLTFQISDIAAVTQMRGARAFVNVASQLDCTTALKGFRGDENSLNALNHLDVNYLKIDPSLIQDLASDESSQKKLGIIQDTVRSTQKSMIATCVTDANSLMVLWQRGVHYAQGNYIQEATPDLDYDFSGTPE